MTKQGLIDTINRIKEMLQPVESLDAESKSLLADAVRLCDDTLLDWKVEQRTGYGLKEAIADIQEIIRYSRFYDSDRERLLEIITALDSGVKNDG